MNGAFYNTPLITAPSQVSNIPSLFLTYLDEMRIFGRILYSLETSNNTITSYTGVLPYALTISDGITTINTAAFSNANTITSLTLPTSIQTINASAFAGCTTLSSLTFTTPTNITTIGCNAFFGATALTQMTQISNMPDSFKVNASQRQIFGKTMYTLFVSNNVVTGAAGTLPSTVTIPAGVTCIGTGAFSIANVSYANTTFIIGNTVQTICANAFYATTDYNPFLVTISLGTSVSYIGSNAFAYLNRITSPLFIPPSVVTIDSGAFTQTGGFAGTLRVTGMQGVTSLSAPAFSNTGAISISLGSNLSNIGPSAFAGSTMLTSITIPAAVTNIGASAFSLNAALSNITFGASTNIQMIGCNAFSGATALTQMSQISNLPDSFKVNASQMQIFGKIMYTLFVSNNVVTGAAGTLPSTVTIPAGVTCIGTGAFALANVSYANTTFIIGNTVQTICANAFAGTNALKNNFYVTVSLGTSVSYIGSNAFAYLNYLQNLFIPPSVVTIENGAFTRAYCSNVTGMEGLTSLNTTAFSNARVSNISFGPASKLTYIGSNACSINTELRYINIPASVTLIDYRALTGVGLWNIDFNVSAGAPDLRLGTEAFWYTTELTSLTLPSRLVSLSSNAFFQPQTLKTIDLSATKLTTIPANAFSSNLGGTCVISLPPTLTSIESNAFAFSTITSITIPASVTSIGVSAFDTVGYAFSNVTFTTPTTIATIGNNAFANNTNINLKSRMVNIPSSFLTSSEMTRIFGKQLT